MDMDELHSQLREKQRIIEMFTEELEKKESTDNAKVFSDYAEVVAQLDTLTIEFEARRNINKAQIEKIVELERQLAEKGEQVEVLKMDLELSKVGMTLKSAQLDDNKEEIFKMKDELETSVKESEDNKKKVKMLAEQLKIIEDTSQDVTDKVEEQLYSEKNRNKELQAKVKVNKCFCIL